MTTKTLAQDLLFEIGTEELPTKAVKSLSEALANNIALQLANNNLTYSNITAFGTPRRIAVMVKDLISVQPNYSVEKRGPALKAAYDQNNNLTPAALGFAKSCNVSADKLTTLETDKGSWLVYKLAVKGQKTTSLLESIVSQAVKALPIPKPMRWNNHEFTFARPVHWALLLYGSKTIKLDILGVTSGNKTYGHRFLAPKAIVIKEPKTYEKSLRKAFVIANFAERMQLISKQIDELAKTHKLKAIVKPSLLEEVTALVEWPQAQLGKFNANFLDVPQECLIISMESHQKYFPVTNSKNKLQPYFIFISNIKSKNSKQVVLGNERVLGARLADAQFFFENDKKSTFSSRTSRLATITYQRKLGSLLDKTKRTEKLCDYIAGSLAQYNIAVERKLVLKAAELCKTDLTTEMIYEFPELQGIMGKYYAQHEGLDLIVANCLEQYYLPKQAGDSLPDSIEACVLSMADKLDTIVGIYATGDIPTGDKDPFGLRRAALGVLRILIEKQLPLDLKLIIETAIANYVKVLSLSDEQKNKLLEDCLAFCLDRLKNYYADQNISLSLLNAVYSTSKKDITKLDSAKQDSPKQENFNKTNAFTTSPYDLHLRVMAANNFQNLPEATQLIAANKRVKNLLSKQNISDLPADIMIEHLKEPAEVKLNTLLENKATSLAPLYEKNDYNSILKSLADLQQPIDNFFDNVMVMCEDKNIKNNRLLLLHKVQGLFNKVADISELQ